MNFTLRTPASTFLLTTLRTPAPTFRENDDLGKFPELYPTDTRLNIFPSLSFLICAAPYPTDTRPNISSTLLVLAKLHKLTLRTPASTILPDWYFFPNSNIFPHTLRTPAPTFSQY